ncbi:M12 family metallo-peptidase [Rhodothermus profundi]|uniref:Por secretion system C-terminal sorting domain-containing protein n=1 Tax=Rhodothermus profundi TaxID=633813 RepID=A0A1M6XT36_9BACT|nr:M12 family metallo-peptidase [Rhodothermus profundi]SHL08975.1 Por secretion system C-terminal sorting domain-containing protein [Rhodothermus profundi]
MLLGQPITLFEEPAVSVEALGTQAQQRWQVLQRLPMAVHLQLVRLPEELWRYRSFTLAVNAAGRLVPGRGQGLGTLTVRRGELSVLSEEAVAWNGRIYVGADTSAVVGEVSLVVLRTGAVTGHVLLGDWEYWVRPLGGGLHALVTIDPRKYPRERPASPYYDGGGVFREAGVSNAVGWGQPEQPVEQARQASAAGRCVQEGAAVARAMDQDRCSPEVVRVLVLYTPKAAQGRDIDGIIYAALNDANQAYRNSAINNLELRLAHKQLFNFEVMGYYPEDDVKALSQDSQARLLRDQYQADVVVLLIDSDTLWWGQGVYGSVADESIPHGSSGEAVVNASQVNQYAYAIVQVDYASAGRYTFVHELGHIQGAQHHPADGIDPQGIPYARGHRFSAYSCAPDCRTRYYATVMAYTPWPYVRIKQFSDPNVTYQGVATGQPDRHNARVLRETADMVADFRYSNDLRARFTYSSASFPFAGLYTFVAMPCGGVAPLSYQWRSCSSPFSCGPVLSTGETFTTYLEAGSHYIRLTVQSSDGQEHTVTQEVYVLDPGCEDELGGFCKRALEDSVRVVRGRLPEAVVLAEVYPNPAQDQVVVRFGLPAAQEVELRVYDVLGREVVRRRLGRMEAGWHREVLSTGHWSAGRYVVVLRAGGRTLTQSITRVR